MSKEKQINIIRDLLIEFDEMGFVPTTTVPNPDAYAIKWRDELVNALIAYRKQTDGRWKGAGMGDYLCSECWSVYSGGDEYNFCPNCGAKMRKEDEG